MDGPLTEHLFCAKQVMSMVAMITSDNSLFMSSSDRDGATTPNGAPDWHFPSIVPGIAVSPGKPDSQKWVDQAMM